MYANAAEFGSWPRVPSIDSLWARLSKVAPGPASHMHAMIGAFSGVIQQQRKRCELALLWAMGVALLSTYYVYSLDPKIRYPPRSAHFLVFYTSN
jgi:hypothetical protein